MDAIDREIEKVENKLKELRLKKRLLSEQDRMRAKMDSKVEDYLVKLLEDYNEEGHSFPIRVIYPNGWYPQYYLPLKICSNDFTGNDDYLKALCEDISKKIMG